MAIEKLYINEKEAAERYGMSLSWFQRCRWAGDGPPYIKLTGAVRYQIKQTDSWFENRMTNSTSQGKEKEQD